MRKPACTADACPTGTAAKSRLDSRPATAAAEVTTFETHRTRDTFRAPCSGRAQRPQAMPRAAAVGLVTHPPCVRDASHRALCVR